MSAARASPTKSTPCVVARHAEMRGGAQLDVRQRPDAQAPFLCVADERLGVDRQAFDREQDQVGGRRRRGERKMRYGRELLDMVIERVERGGGQRAGRADGPGVSK
ncbi:hypothetical protein [Burkholderia stagnalis]|uniref:hypothetical protein n=1 Tax=Burkholderia stagnalis TaxID=1503054 RepID=UPI00075567E9|nr:hypothetical protein [Burkholderia stagnalis]KVM88121.1 hypothetical protein WT07_33155 [Burkholderia stagnalis]KWE10566.1 hypothetical protein WT47_08890 [Burkholderia stagnalis]KWE18888.1 hypothetical protein WT48_12055 [Burkholderia stagnalis]KWO74053.1 hypothetical protein WU00_13135 [Burkholderia stagnalis]